MAVKRLTRREIVQEDKILTFLYRAYGWLVRNRKVVMGVLLLVGLAFFGVYLWRSVQQKHEKQLQKQFAEALEIYHTPLETENQGEDHEHAPLQKYHFGSREERYSKAKEAFGAIAQLYPKKRLGLFARYYLAISKYQLGEREAAKKVLGSLIDETDQLDITNLALQYLAQMAQSEKDHAQTVALLNEFIETSPLTFPRQTALLSLAQSYEAMGKVDEALKNYRKLIAQYPASEISRTAQSRVEQLEGEHPRSSTER